MGLDMHLSKKIHIGANFDFNGITGDIKIKKHGVPVKINLDKVTSVVEVAGYWRKANAIHRWFVENVQEGEDDCGNYYVSKENLKKLLDTVNTVLDASKLVKGKVANGYTYNKKGEKVYNYEEGMTIEDSKVARELLPTADGFFFGGTHYDEFYYEDLKYTKEILEKALLDGEGDFYYHSSW